MASAPRRVWLIVAIALLATIALVGGVIIGSRLGARRPLPAPAGIDAEFARVQAKLHGVAGIAAAAVGSGSDPMMLGDWRSGPAWSTIKVPVVIAALREQNPPQITDPMTAAITKSDNAAAEAVWESLGDPVVAAAKVDAVLRQFGDSTLVQSRRVRPEFSASGQTEWPLAAQARFASAAVCDSASAPVFALMGHVEQDQSWGIGTIAGTRFKGGWGPAPNGTYLVRQFGVLAVPNGLIAIALAVQPDSGKFEDGTADLTEMAHWVRAHLADLPAGRCGR